MKTNLQTTWRRQLAAVASGALMFAALGMTPAHAVLNDGFFELDGNTADGNAGAKPDDWNSFYFNQANTTRATGITPDTVPAVFRNGSKDILDISAWRYDLGSSPPKTDMLNAYAAAYTTTAGDLLIYFGADRASFTGTASLGFWFFKNPVKRNDATGSFINPVTNQPATHAEGDVLLAFEYNNGGAVTGIRVFKWTGGALVDQGVVGASPTNVASVYCNAADTACGSTNASNLALPWNGTISAGQFFEGGVNLSKLLPGGDTCFSAFMATSRSSTEPNASIKNFIIDEFPVCSLSVTKACKSAVYDSSTNTVLNTVVGKILNDGGGTLTNIAVVDNPTAFNANSLQWFQCDPTTGLPNGNQQSPSSLTAGASICYQGQTTSNSLETKDTVTASAGTPGGGTVSGTSNEATCLAQSPNTALTVTKECDVDLVLESGKLAVRVDYTLVVTNTGSAGLTGVKVCEAHEVALDASTDACAVGSLGTTRKEFVVSGTLAPGASVTFTGEYYPTDFDVANLLTPDTAVFKDKAAAQGTKPAILGGGTIKAHTDIKNCPLCN